MTTVEQLQADKAALLHTLKEICEAVEMQAAKESYRCGLGVSEWDAFIDRQPLYPQYKNAMTVIDAYTTKEA